MVRHIISIIWASILLLPVQAQTQEQQVKPLMPGETPQPTKYVAVEEEKEHLVLFQGFTLEADVYGPVAYLISDYGTIGGALRLNLKNTFFPIVEAGYGKCKKEDFNTKVTYKVGAPYARVGLDINMLRDKFQNNRLYLGARYGISTYQYDMICPAMTDPIWGGSEPFNMKGIDCTSHWAEVVMGVEVSIYKNFHMGWSVRYKREISSTKSDFAKPSCIPGYGYTTNATCWGATYSLIFDLNWGLKKSHRKGVKVEIGNIPPVAEHEEELNQTEQKQTEQEEINGDTKGNRASEDDRNDGKSGESDESEPEEGI